jgi:hypothetical protein
MANEPSSHVTTRRLTKSWEVGQRRLRFYDFVTDRFGDRSSKTLLTADASFGEDVEGFLNTSIENSLASHLDALEAGTWETKIPWEHERSLLFSLMLQPTRVLAGRGDAASKGELDDLRTKGDAYLDLLARAADDRFRRIGVRLPVGQELFFPSHGFEQFPLAGRSRAMTFQPTTPSTLFLCVLKEVPQHVVDEQIAAGLDTGTFVAFSVGLDCEKVILPPSLVGQDEAEVRAMLLKLRSCAQAYAKVIASANAVAGL